MTNELYEALKVLDQMIEISATADGANHMALAGTYILKLKPLHELHIDEFKAARAAREA